MTIYQSKHVAYILPCVIKTVVLTYKLVLQFVSKHFMMSSFKHCICFKFTVLGSCDGASWNAWWREVNQQDATNRMFIIKLLSQYVSGIIMPIIRRTRPCITAYNVLHWLCWLWLCVQLGRKLCALCEGYCSNSNIHTVSCVHCVKVTVRTVIFTQ